MERVSDERVKWVRDAMAKVAVNRPRDREDWLDIVRLCDEVIERRQQDAARAENVWRMVPLEDGQPVQYVGVYVLRWRQEWGEPEVGFAEEANDAE